MNFLQKVIGAIFPPYRFRVLRREQSMLFTAIISCLPDALSEIKMQTLSGRFFNFSDWDLFPEFKFVEIGYKGDTLLKYKKPGLNFKIAGLKIFSRLNGKHEAIEILVQDNLIAGLRITGSAYGLREFDLTKIQSDEAYAAAFAFPPDDIDIFYAGLPEGIRAKLRQDDLFEIDFDSSIYLAFYDINDGNYLAVDQGLNVYSLVHDAKPASKHLETSFEEMLDDIAGGRFDEQKHLDERYRNVK